jgi:hypothetical protein
MFLAGGRGPITAEFPNISADGVGVSGVEAAAAGFGIGLGGSWNTFVYFTGTGADSGVWKTSGNSSDFEFNVALTFSSIDPAGSLTDGSTSGWVPAQDVSCDVGQLTVGASGASWLVQIRNKYTGDVLASGTVQLTATVP